MTTTLPPDSILANTAEILKACELAEISIASTQSTQSFHLVTQLACLLLLGKYNHARHLWRRYNLEVVPETDMEYSKTSTKTGEGVGVDVDVDLDLYQFQLLWKAVQPFLQSYFGNVSLLHTGTKELFVSLQSCVDANLHPLSLYAKELIEGFQNQMAALIETVYDTIQESKCKSLLGVSEDQSFNQVLVQRGWEKKEGSQDIWIPGSPESKIVGNNEQKSKIELLSSVVGFLEKKNVQC